MACLAHFVFLYSVPIRHCNSGADSGGKLCQLVSPPLRLPEDESQHGKKERRIWNTYQKLSLELRVGSDSFESSQDSYDEITAAEHDQGSICQYRPSVLLHEKCLEDESFITSVDGDELYAALGGPNYEFYAVLPASLSSPLDAKILCSTLVETLMSSKGEELQPLSFL